MISRYPLLELNVTKQRIRLPIVAAHAHLLVTSQSVMRDQSIRHFSAAC
jgi:hypothetical protein